MTCSKSSQGESRYSNVTEFSSRDDIKTQAAHWLVRIDQGALSNDEEDAFSLWVSTSSLHRDYLMSLAEQWDSMAVMEELSELFPLPDKSEPAGLEQDNRRVESLRWGSMLKKMLAPAVSVMVLLVVVLLANFEWFGDKQKIFETAVGEHARYELQDGSVITLNTDSIVSVTYTDSRRLVRLLQGEANFDVTKDKKRPFVIYAGEGMVWAVGTIFNVRLIGKSVEVLVKEGAVKVFADVMPEHDEPLLIVDLEDLGPLDTDAKQALLNAGQSLIYDHVVRDIARIEEKNIDEMLAWQEGKLIFTGETLERALEQISRYTNKQLIIMDPAIKDVRVGGHYKTNDIDALLISISTLFNLEAKKVSEDRIHFFAKPNSPLT